MIDKIKVDMEIATGLSAVCAWCEHWHNAKDRGLRINCGEIGCGGPHFGKGFPRYKGPMSGNLHAICFVCGGKAIAGVEIGGRMLGVCDKKGPEGKDCFGHLKSILARNKTVVHERVVPVVGNG